MMPLTEYECIVLMVADALLSLRSRGLWSDADIGDVIEAMAKFAADGDVDVIGFVNSVHKEIYDGRPFIQEPTIR